jgi:hypothetical protein
MRLGEWITSRCVTRHKKAHSSADFMCRIPNMRGIGSSAGVVDSIIFVTDSRNTGSMKLREWQRSLLPMFGFAMCCALFAASMVAGSLWLATTLTR